MVRAALAVPHPRSVRQSLGLSRERMARLFDVSAKTIERWESRDTPPASQHARKRLAELQEIADLAHIIYKPESVTLFLTTPFPTFDGRTALQVIESGRADLVMDALAEDYEGIGFQVALDDFLHPWSGAAYRHIPAGSSFDILDFRFAGRGRGNRWDDAGLPTLYLARDHGVAIGEFARHLQVDRTTQPRLDPEFRQIYRLALALDRLLDLRDPAVCDSLALASAPQCFLDRTIARATARYVRSVSAAQAIIVPSAAFIDDPDRWVLVLFLEKLPDDPRRFILTAEPDGVLRVDP